MVFFFVFSKATNDTKRKRKIIIVYFFLNRFKKNYGGGVWINDKLKYFKIFDTIYLELNK